MEFKRKPMVNWYDPKQLASTGLKTVLSGVFGSFADRREVQAALDPKKSFYDFTKSKNEKGVLKEDLWLDFVSDLGDGFDATYTIADLLGQAHLDIGDIKIKRGDVLVMGGDEVYPTPEKHEYRNRLQGPFHAAFPGDKNDPDPPQLFAIPGNHDWYDGLSNFTKIFCQKRALGNWRTVQSRSYFALKLPHNYWLFAIDIQLNADIDLPQLKYFKKIAKKHLLENDKIILVTAEPSWVYQSFDQKNSAQKRFNFFMDHVIYGKPFESYRKKNKRIEITVILTGDLHHYARYEEKGPDNQICQLITSGGGGAFMHPTHTLYDEISPKENYKATLKEVYPSKKVSGQLGLRNLIFPWYSLTMLLFFGILHLFTTWLLQVGTKHGTSFMQSAAEVSSLGEYISLIGNSIALTPSVLALNLLLWGGLIIFTDVKSGKGNWNYIAGFFHGLFQLANFYLLIWAFSWLNMNVLELGIGEVNQVLLFSLQMIFIGGMISGIIFGIYLLISVNFLDNHITEGSSSYRWEGYKNFLRLHLTKDALTIYPIGVKKVVKNWKDIGTEKNPKFSGDPISFELIEKPIIIRHREEFISDKIKV